MRKTIMSLLMAILILTVVTAAKPISCEDWTSATCNYNDGVIVVHSPDYFEENNAICVEAIRFSEETLQNKVDGAWYYSSHKEGYICKWSK